MNSQQPYTPSTPGNPYDFIMNPAPPPKHSINPFAGNKLLSRIILGLGSAFVVLSILIVVVSLTTKASKVSNADLLSIAQTQQEIMRISAMGTSDSVRQTTRNLAVTTQFTVKAQQQQIITKLDKQGSKPGQKELTLKQDAKVDQKFAAAKATSTFDQAYTEVMQDQLANYAKLLQSLTTKTPAGTLRETFSDYNQQTQLLIAEIPYAQQSIKADS